MDNLEIKVTQQQGVISTNFETVEAEIKTAMEDYKNYVVTEDSIKVAKKDLAELRKKKTEIDDARKQVKREWEKPLKEFEERCKKLTALVDEPINLINKQLNLFEEERKSEKKERCIEIFNESVGKLADYLKFEKVYNDKWLNVSYSETDIRYDISEALTKIRSDLSVIEGLHSEIHDEIIKTYINSDNNLSVAVARNSQYLEDKNRMEKLAKEKAEREKKEREELERKAVEETVVDEVQGFKEEEVEGFENPTPIDNLNNFVNKTKTATIIVSLEDLQSVKNALDFAEIKYEILED